MVFDPAVLALVLGISTLANAIVAAVVKPIFEKFVLDNFWIMYISWVVAGVLVFLANVNLFAGVFANPLVGLLVTAVICGRASNIIHDVTDQKSSVLIANVPEDKTGYNVITDLEGNDDLEPNTKDANGNLTYPSGIKVEGGSDNGELEK